MRYGQNQGFGGFEQIPPHGQPDDQFPAGGMVHDPTYQPPLRFRPGVVRVERRPHWLRLVALLVLVCVLVGIAWGIGRFILGVLSPLGEVFADAIQIMDRRELGLFIWFCIALCTGFVMGGIAVFIGRTARRLGDGEKSKGSKKPEPKVVARQNPPQAPPYTYGQMPPHYPPYPPTQFHPHHHGYDEE